MENLEMMVGYEIGFFESKFNDNYKKLSYYMYSCLKETIGDKVAGIAIEENLLYAWSYYFTTIADEDAKTGDRLMMGLVNHFSKLMEDKENIKVSGTGKSLLMLDPSFCRMWFGTSLHVMLMKQYGKEKYEEAFSYIKENYLSKECKVRTLMLREVAKKDS
ncbi:MAG: hypothetical protein ACRC7R_07645 [Sarcina sp.]